MGVNLNTNSNYNFGASTLSPPAHNVVDSSGQTPASTYVPQLVSKAKIITTIMSSGKEIFPSGLNFLRLAFMTAITYPNQATSLRFKAKSVHATQQFFKIWSQAYFKDTHIKPTVNIAKKDVLFNKEDQKATNELLEIVKTKNSPYVKISNKIDQKMITDGICCGIRIDIAQRNLLEKVPVEEILKDNEHGARAQAAGNQAVYENLESTFDLSTDGKTAKLGMLLSKLENLNVGLFTQKDIRTAAQMAIAVDGFLDDQVDNAIKFRSQYLSEAPNPAVHILQNSFKEKCKEATKLNQDGKTHDFLTNVGGAWVIYNYDKFRKFALQELNTHFNQQSFQTSQELAAQNEAFKETVLQLDLAICLLENKNQDIIQLASSSVKFTEASVANNAFKTLRPLIRQVSYSVDDGARMNAVASARGLKLTSLEKTLGYSSLQSDDASYLQNLPKLPVGVYSVDIKTSSGEHAITYVREENSCYVLDPNGFQVICKSPEDAIVQMQKILNMYSEAKSKPANYSGKPYHEIEIQKFVTI